MIDRDRARVQRYNEWSGKIDLKLHQDTIVVRVFTHNDDRVRINKEDRALPSVVTVFKNEGTNAGALTFGTKGFAFTLSE